MRYLYYVVGADFYWHIGQDRAIQGNGHTAVESKIGYLLSGPLSPHSNVDTVEALQVGITALQEASDTKQFWNVEFTGTIPKSTASLTNNQQIADYINSSIRHQADGSYVVKYNHPYLPPNRGICEKRTRSLARKLAQTPELLKIYGNIIAERLTHGFIEKVAESDVPLQSHFIHIMQSRRSPPLLQSG